MVIKGHFYVYFNLTLRSYRQLYVLVLSLNSKLSILFKIGWSGPPIGIKSEIVIFPEGPLRYAAVMGIHLF